MRVSDQSLHGKHVISADGSIIGSVHGVFLDGVNLRLDCIAVAVRKDLADRLGVQHGLFQKGLVEIPADQIQSIGETIVLAVPLASLRTVAAQPSQTQPMPKEPEPRTDGERPIHPHPHM